MWKEDLVRCCFLPTDASHILRFPLQPALSRDVLIWWGTISGKFTVKSAYHVASSRIADHAAAGSSNDSNMFQFWKALWSLALPKKILNFLWKVCINILPTRDSLSRRNVCTPLECPICGGEAESPNHIFHQRIYARKVWATSEWGSNLYSALGSNNLDWIWGIWKFEGEVVFTRVAVVLWSIWNVHNSAVFKDSVKIPSKVAADALRYIQEFQNAQVKPVHMVQQVTRESVRWSAPVKGWYKVNMDGAIFANIQKVGIGVVIRNDGGEFLGALCELLDYDEDAVDAEALAALRAIEFATEVCPFNMIFEGDCLQVIKALSSDEYDLSRIGHLFVIARSKFSLLSGHLVVHVHREGNSVAHCLAQYARNVVES